jgi:hypothetical protein
MALAHIMKKLPSVLSLVLCDALDFRTRPGRASIVGVFHARHSRTFPTSAQPFVVYAALYDGIGEGRMELLITRLETETDIHRYRQWFAFPGRGLVANFVITLKKCVFPAPGRYSIVLSFENEELARRYLDVYRVR